MKKIQYTGSLKEYVQSPANQEMINSIISYRKIDSFMFYAYLILGSLFQLIGFHLFISFFDNFSEFLIFAVFYGFGLFILWTAISYIFYYYILFKNNSFIIDGKEIIHTINKEGLKQAEFNENLLRFSENARILKESLDKKSRKPYKFEILLLRKEAEKDLME